MKVTAENYESLKGFYGRMVEYTRMLPPNLSPESHPMAHLKIFEEKSPAIARRSLTLGIGDMVEMTMDWSSEQIRAADIALADLRLPTLTTVSLEFSRKIKGILDRRCVRNETEYHALRNVVESMADSQMAGAWQILGAYELQRMKP